MTESIVDRDEPPQASRIGRLARWLARSLTISLIVFLAGYFWFAIPFWFGKPNVSRRFVSDFNRQVAALPPEETAWATFRAAALVPKVQVEGDPWQEGIIATTPDDPLWGAFVVAVEKNRPRVVMAREASLKLRIGGLLSTESDPAFDSKRPLEERANSKWSVDVEENPLLLECMLPGLGAVRGLMRDVISDVRVAAEANDSRRVVDGIQTILRLSELAPDPPELICQLVGIAVAASATGEIGRTIAAYPGLLDDADLLCLSQDLHRMLSVWRQIEFSWERDMTYDVVQRWFTDDGNGDGMLTMNGLQEAFKDANRGPLSWSDLLWSGPMGSKAFGSRKQVVDLLDRVIAGAVVDGHTPVSERISWRSIDAVEGPNADIGFKGSLIVTISTRTFAKAIDSLQGLRARIEATRFVIEVERFRLRNGEYPKSVEQLVNAGFNGPPLDIFDARPLRYLFRGGEMPLVYSVGVDREDDGGAPASDGRSTSREMLTELEFKELSPDIRQRMLGDLIYWPPLKSSWIDGSEQPFVVQREAMPGVARVKSAK